MLGITTSACATLDLWTPNDGTNVTIRHSLPTNYSEYSERENLLCKLDKDDIQRRHGLSRQASITRELSEVAGGAVS